MKLPEAIRAELDKIKAITGEVGDEAQLASILGVYRRLLDLDRAGWKLAATYESYNETKWKSLGDLKF